MKSEDMESELSRLKSKRVELASKASMATELEEKEEFKQEIKRIQDQIDTIEKYCIKRD